jgi:iron complex outermembrane receptor protein
MTAHILYTISPKESYTILVSFVGLQTIKKSVTVKNGETYNLDFNLVENENQLQEIVVSANRSVNERPTTIGKLPIKPMDLPQAVVTVSEMTIKINRHNG